MTEAGELSSQEQQPLPVQSRTRRRWLRWILKALGTGLFTLVLVGMMGWTILAVYFAGVDGHNPRTFLASLLAILLLAFLIFMRPFRRSVLACFCLFVIVLVWFFSLQPSNDRDWATDVAMIPTARIVGNLVTIHNVRHFDYRSVTDFTPRWEQRNYDLSKLRTVDFLLSFWGPKAIAHAMVSFGFDGNRYLAASIEARRQKSESYSAVASFFRQFELVYVFADERDLIGLRTNYRHENVYLYHSTLTPAQARALFLSYLDNANSLARKAQFYNALTSNCATNAMENARQGAIPTQFSWRVLLNGFVTAQLYANHRIDTSLPLEQLIARSNIDAAANKAGNSADFSSIIRAGLPVPAGFTFSQARSLD